VRNNGWREDSGRKWWEKTVHGDKVKKGNRRVPDGNGDEERRVSETVSGGKGNEWKKGKMKWQSIGIGIKVNTSSKWKFSRIALQGIIS
jgi:hypothetical protein